MRAAIGFILVTITLDILSMSLIIPVLPPLIQSMEGGSAAAAAHVVGIFATGWALMQFLASPVQGALSDRFGRRPVILLSNLGLGLNGLLLAMAPDVRWLFLARIISGITAASFSCASAYIADITAPDQRAARFGLVSVAFGFGFITGPVAGSLLGAINPRLPFWVAAGLSLLNFLFGLFILPESLPPERRAPFRWRHANPVGALRLLRSRPGLTSLAAVQFLGLTAQNALPTITVLYAINRYGFTMRQLSVLLGVMGISSALVGGLLTGPVVRRLGERRALLVGLACGMVGFAAMGLAITPAMFLLAIPLLSLRGFADPALTALMTRKVRPQEQGALQGASSSLLGIAGLMAPTLYTESYALFAVPRHGWHVPGMPFLIAASLLLCAVLLAMARVRRLLAVADPMPG
ncbi:MAG TPA: TCR/Tet family MFS transporter [Acetobacteraceae bacterium]|nr:TCR/Tet family MFS transporter [Acetobacteraceae bacterium]